MASSVIWVAYVDWIYGLINETKQKELVIHFSWTETDKSFLPAYFDGVGNRKRKNMAIFFFRKYKESCVMLEKGSDENPNSFGHIKK